MTREEFMVFVHLDKETGCWNWMGSLTDEGYGRVWRERRSWNAHRLSFQLHCRTPSCDEVVKQICENRRCVNPNHLDCRPRLVSYRGQDLATIEQLCELTHAGCWEWKGSRDKQGYGLIGGLHDKRRTHRVAWILAFGPIPNDLFVCHKCDNPPCCNPDHFFLGTAQDNHDDMIQKGRGALQRPGQAKRMQALRGRHAQFSDETIREMRERRAAGASLNDLADAYGIPFGTVSVITTGRIYRTSPGPISRRWMDATAAADIRARRAAGEAAKMLATEFNVTPTRIYQICK